MSNLAAAYPPDVPVPTDSTKQLEFTFRVVEEREVDGKKVNEILLLKPLFDRMGWALPDPNYAKVIVAEIVGEKETYIGGFGVVQFVPCAGDPIWVDPNLRGTGLAEALVANIQHYVEVDCGIKRYICHARVGSLAARLAEKYGMKLMPEMGVYRRQVG